MLEISRGVDAFERRLIWGWMCGFVLVCIAGGFCKWGFLVGIELQVSGFGRALRFPIRFKC